MTTMTRVRVLESNDTYSFPDRGAEPSELERANENEARAKFASVLRAGGTALAKMSADAPYKSVTAFPEDAVDVVLLPRVAGG